MTGRRVEPEVEAPNRSSSVRELGSLRRELVRNAACVTANRADAEDAVQTALLRAVERELNQTKLHAWLKTVVRNCAIDLKRENRRRAAKPLEAAENDLVVNASCESEAVGRASLETDLWTIVDACTPKLRRVLELRYLLGLSYDEIAKRLDIPSKTVATRLHRAHELIRRQLSARLARESGAVCSRCP